MKKIIYSTFVATMGLAAATSSFANTAPDNCSGIDKCMTFSMGDGEIVLEHSLDDISHIAFGAGTRPFGSYNFARLEGESGEDLVFTVLQEGAVNSDGYLVGSRTYTDDRLVIKDWLKSDGTPKLRTFSFENETFDMEQYVSERSSFHNFPRIEFQGFYRSYPQQPSGISSIDYSGKNIPVHYRIDHGVDSVVGGAGDDTYRYYNINRDIHTVLDDSGGVDSLTIHFIGNPDVLDFTIVGDDLVIKRTEDSSITIRNWLENNKSKIETFHFLPSWGTGTAWEGDEILSNIAPHLLDN